MKSRDRAERNHLTNMVDAWQKQTIVGEMDWYYVCRMLLSLSGELGRKRTARLMYSMADQLHFDASMAEDGGVYWLVRNDEGYLLPEEGAADELDRISKLPGWEIVQIVREVRMELRKLHEALTRHKECGKKVNWPKFGAMIDDLRRRLGPSDAGWLITELADNLRLVIQHKR